jgi:hypothetical protein
VYSVVSWLLKEVGAQGVPLEVKPDWPGPGLQQLQRHEGSLTRESEAGDLLKHRTQATMEANRAIDNKTDNKGVDK